MIRKFSFPDRPPYQPPPDGVKCNPTRIITLEPTLTAIRSVLLLEHNQGVRSMPQMSKQAYQNLMQASRKYARVTHSIKVPRQPVKYFTTRPRMLAYKKRHNIALIYCTTHHQF